MISLLAPAMLLTALLAVPILLLYMLKLRRQEVSVSSTLLWQQLLRDRQANTPWQRLKRSLFLLLQLLILALLVLALARPALPAPSPVSGPTVLLLDASASMNASDAAPTRFAAAQAAAAGMLDGLPANAAVTVILAGAQPRLLASAETDRLALRRALAAAQPEQGSADWPAALALAAGAASDERSAIVVLSDGGLPQNGLPPLPVEAHYLPVGQSADNLAVAALAVRPAAAGPQLFVSVHNYAGEPRQVVLSFYAGEQLFAARQITVPAQQNQDVLLDNLPQTANAQDVQRYMARLSPPAGESGPLDFLPLDDQAEALYRPAATGRVLLLSKGNLFLRQLLGSLPGIQPFLLVPGEDLQTRLTQERYDVYILDGIVPADLPPGNLLILNPPENAFFQVNGSFSDMRQIQTADHTLTRFVDWKNVHVRSARQVVLPDWAQWLVRSQAGPLVFAGETAGRRLAVVTFDLHDSDLPLQITYPILFANLIQYLAPAQNLSAAGDEAQPAAFALGAGDSLQIRPGEGILVHPAGEAGSARVTLPDGSRQSLTLEQGKALFQGTQQTGVYTLDYPGHPELGSDAFAVNLFDPGESAIAPQSEIRLGQTQLRAGGGEDAGQHELWPWLAALALVVLLLEWLLYQQYQGRSLAGLFNRLRRRA